MSKQFWTSFLEVYMKNKCLWDTNCESYKNRARRAKAFNELVRKFREIDPAADKTTVTKKINSLRTAFRAAHKKYEVLKSGAEAEGLDEVAEPRLWCYKIMLPLIEKNEKSANSAVLGVDLHQDEDSESAEDIETEQQLERNMVYEVEIHGNGEDLPLDHIYTSTARATSENLGKSTPMQNISPKNPVTKRTKKSTQDLMGSACKAFMDTADVPMDTMDQSSYSSPNEFGAFGSNVAFKLEAINKINFEQRVLAEKLINDVLFLAQLGRLTQSLLKFPL